MPGYYTTARISLDRVEPGQIPSAVGVTADPTPAGEAGEIIGIAYESGRVGGWRHPDREPEFLGPREATWRLVIGKMERDGRFLLRKGKFVELGEDAI